MAVVSIGLVSRSLDRNPTLRRWGRYGATSIVATLVSEATLLAVYGSGLLPASAAAIVASLAGTIPSYLMSRYWIWPEADRHRPVRQAAVYWCISVANIAVASAATGWAAAHAPVGQVAHLAFVGLAYLVIYGALWVIKFVLYQRFLFRTAANTSPEPLAKG